MGITAPTPLTSEHNLADFCCSDHGMNEWLKKKALKNHSSGLSRVYVICIANTRQVIGYYCLSTGSIQRNLAPGAMRHNAPEPLPVVVLGRLAIDQAWAGKGLGVALLKDAVYRTMSIAQQVGVRALIVHALDDSVRNFYLKYAFVPSPFQSLTLLYPITLE